MLFFSKHAFRYPLGGCPRIAILVDWFGRSRRQVAVTSSPAALVGTREQLLRLDPRPLTHAVIVVVRPGGALLSSAERDQLWRAFRVPVFEQIIGHRGRLLAAECEAHDGLHIVARDAVWTAYARDESPCACGLKTARVSQRAVSAMSA